MSYLHSFCFQEDNAAPQAETAGGQCKHENQDSGKGSETIGVTGVHSSKGKVLIIL